MKQIIDSDTPLKEVAGIMGEIIFTSNDDEKYYHIPQFFKELPNGRFEVIEEFKNLLEEVQEWYSPSFITEKEPKASVRTTWVFIIVASLFVIYLISQL